MKSEKKVWFVTGSSTGLGRALVFALLNQGYHVIGTARKPETLDPLVEQYPEQLITLPVDVTSKDQIHKAVEKAEAHFGQIDVLVNNAGYGLQSAIEEATDQQIRHQFEVNLFGAIEMIKAVLPIMRQQGSGHIANVTSVGGFTGAPSFGYYVGTKFALEGVSESLALEAAHLGIKVTIIEPGAFRTEWAGRSLVRSTPMSSYEKSVGAAREWIDNENGKQQGDPALGAAAIIKAITSPNPPLRLVIGKDALDRIRQKIYSMSDELNFWENVTVNTAFTQA